MAIYTSGTIINNRYEVVQGPLEKPSLAGGMGLVYLCVDHAEDGKPVALKTFRPELLSDRVARDRFLREGTTWVELGKHPHIVHCYQVFGANIGPEVFFALELVAAAEGKKDASLRSWLIPNKPLPLEQALLFALHICRGMVHATHKIPGLVHRDLKPENILIGRDGRARVTDFGLASAAQNLGSDWHMDDDTSSSHIRTQLTHGIAGTPLYMSPEQWADEPLDERSDIYTFGCILYEMVCGSFAVIGDSIEELKDSHCHGMLREITTELNEPLSILIQRCLALNRANRYNSWVELEKFIVVVYFSIIGEMIPPLEEKVKDTRSDNIAVGWSYNAMGLSYQDIGKIKAACNYFEQVLATARKESEHALEVAGLHNIGIAYVQLGEIKLAIKFFEKDLAIAREIGDCHGEGQALSCLGISYLELGDSSKAIEFHEKHLEIVREIGNLSEEGKALGNLGNAYIQIGDPRRAIEFHEQWLSISREIGDRHDEGCALGNLGISYARLGEHHRAIEFFKQDLAITREIGDRLGEGQAIGNLGNSYRQIGNHNQAIELFKQHLAIVYETGDIIGAASTSYNMASLLQHDRPSEALKYAKEALHIVNQIGNEQFAARVQALIEKIRG